VIWTGDWWIKKFSPDGTEISAGWNKQLSGASIAVSDYPYSIQSDHSGSIYAAGTMGNASGNLDGCIKKYSSGGTEIVGGWNKLIDGSGGNDEIRCLAVDADGNLYAAGTGTNLVTGTSGKDWWIKKYNSSGTEITSGWNKKIDGNGGDDVILCIKIDSFGGIFFGGYGTNLISGTSGQDWWVRHYDPEGNLR
jgi:hypothetical protein